MDIQNCNGKQIQVGLPMNIAQEQYVFADRLGVFDPNMCSAVQFSPPDTTSNTEQTAIIAPFHAITTDYNELSPQNQDISLVPSSEVPNNCITYSNVIFVPTLTNTENQLDQLGDAIELVKHETPGIETNDGQSYKYIVSSDSRFVNTFIRTNELDNATSILSNDTTGAFIEQPSHMITTVSQINEDDLVVNGIQNEPNQIHSNLHNVEQMDQNQISLEMHTGDDQEVLMQDENGQLYRQVQNIFVNGASMCPNELLPFISAPVDLADPDYVEQSMNRIQNTFQQRDHIDQNTPFQLPVNFVSNPDAIATSKPLDTNLDMQQVEFIFNSYRNDTHLDTHHIDTNHIDANHIVTNHYTTESDTNILDDKTNYQTHSAIHANNDSANQHGSLLESTMSTLLAAVNDITAREEQFQQYLNTGKSDYYSASRIENMPSVAYTSPTTKPSSDCAKELPKSLSIGAIANELFPNSCDSPTDEYVDINDMEFIEKGYDEDQQEKNILMRRTRRKKTTKRKDDALLVVDKFVLSRAIATLPTSYLYFETTNNDGRCRSKQTVFSKRDIPLDMKFGPIVGDTKTLNKHEIKMYRETNANFTLLFLSHNSILDVSNENTSNWMRYVRLATKYREQNLSLCVINSQFYFKCCKYIDSKQELRVGYSKEYAKKYNLNYLLPKKMEKCAEYLCKQCDQRFVSNDLLQNHLTEHKTKDAKPQAQSMPRITPTKSDTSSPTKSKDRLNTGAIRMRRLALSKTSRTSGPTVRYACCYCSKVFTKFLSYKKHTNVVHSVNIEHKRVTVDAEHKRLTIEDSIMKNEPMKENESGNIGAKQWFVCQTCQRHFMTPKKLEKHRLSDCSDTESMTVQCHICLKHLQTPSALSMHIKTHNTVSGIIKCPLCSQRYQSTIVFKEHVKSHMINGSYKCPHCIKQFPKYSSIRKHIRINHSAVRFVCHECGKDFKSKYKLKEHSLCHSDVREFSCADCDKQFKRKDKLREHILRIHVKINPSKKINKIKAAIKDDSLEILPEETSTDDHQNALNLNELDNFEEKDCSMYSDLRPIQFDDIPVTDPIESTITKPKFQPKVPPTDYERFIYKCEHCLLGFKRRGMLVNHMAKRHPDIRIESIHELSLPILKTERCFYCQYCEKVYKSSSKRKAHILKYHPGQKLPESTRNKTEECEDAIEPNLSFSANVGSVTTNAHQCMWCYKQYASRSRLLHHKRKEHSKEIEESFKQSQNDYFKDLNVIMDSHESHFHPSQMQINQSIDEYAMQFTEMHESEPHRFHHIGYEPENRLLELSSAALETFRDDYSFLSDSDAHTGTMEHTNMDGSRVDVNFKMVGDEFDGQDNSNCDLHSLPQLFEEIDCMSLKPNQFTSSSSVQMDHKTQL